MKLKNIKIKKYKLLKLYLAKHQIYKKFSFSSIFDPFLNQIELNFKRALFIIYYYHIWNKTILFVGLPHPTNKKILSVFITSKHIFIPKSIWINGLIGNKKSISKNSKFSLYFKRFLKCQNDPHLIVLFNPSNSINLNAESAKLNIPLISFGISDKISSNITYLIYGNFFSKKFKQFYQFLIYSILKKAKNKVSKHKKPKQKRVLNI